MLPFSLVSLLIFCYANKLLIQFSWRYYFICIHVLSSLYTSHPPSPKFNEEYIYKYDTTTINSMHSKYMPLPTNYWHPKNWIYSLFIFIRSLETLSLINFDCILSSHQNGFVWMKCWQKNKSNNSHFIHHVAFNSRQRMFVLVLGKNQPYSIHFVIYLAL